jgi:pSer/pThr/pTyr-binding forkhead associated (FHA) protein
MTEVPKNAHEESTSDERQVRDEEDAPDDYGSTSIDKNMMERLRKADEARATKQAEGAQDEPDTGEDGLPSTAVVRYSTTPEALEDVPKEDQTNPGTTELGTEAIVNETSAPKEPPPSASTDEDPVPDDAPRTELQVGVVGIDDLPPEKQPEKPPTKREPRGGDLKATLDLPNEASEALSDNGWGSSDNTGSSTKSGLGRSAEPETGALRQLDERAASTVLAKDMVQKPQEAPELVEDPDAPRLICIQGPDIGKEFVLTGRDIAIGRAPTNDVIVNDPSVSRVHCRLLIDQGQYIATDQRSGNGTIVNGSKIERANLKSGSTIKIGQTVLRFVEMGDVIKSTETESHKLLEAEHRSRIVETPRPRQPQEQPETNSKQGASKSARYAIAIVAFAAVVGIIIVVWSVASRRGGDDRSPAEIAEEAYDSASLALKARELDRAQDKLNLALTAVPGDARFIDLQQLVQRERGNFTALNEARARAREGRFSEALVAISAISKDTTFKAELAAVREEVRELVLQAVRKAIDGKDVPTMVILARDIGDTFKDEPDVKRLQEKVSKGEKQAPAPNEKSAIEKPAAPVDKAPADKTASAPDKKSGNKALDAFVAGQAESALEQLAQGGGDEATALKNKIGKFMEVYNEAKSGRTEAQIKKALAFESKIAQGRSAYAKELKALQAEALVQNANKALDAKQFLQAYKMYKEALSLAPDASAPKAKLADIQRQARDLVNKGYIKKDSDRGEARAIWESVLTMVPPDDEMYLKAKKWLDMTK